MKKNNWISIKDQLPKEWVSVIGYMTDSGNFPSVRECYSVGGKFFFPALNEFHPISHWMEFPEKPHIKT